MNLSAAYLKKQEEWKLEGKLEGKLEAAIAFLRAGATSEFIAQAMEMPIETIENLRDNQKAIGNHRI
jgi:predicted transposase YdaD